MSSNIMLHSSRYFSNQQESEMQYDIWSFTYSKLQEIYIDLIVFPAF